MLAAVVCGVLLIGCLGCLAMGNLVLDEQSVVVPTVAATATYDWPEPEVVGPTSTASPVPTYTPQPTIIPVSTYRAEMLTLLLQYVEAQEATAALNHQGSADPTLLFDDQWKVDIALSLGQSLIIGSEIRALKPPQEFEETHGYLVKATEHYDAFVYLYSTGIDTLDASLIAQSAEELGLAADWMDRATEAVP